MTDADAPRGEHWNSEDLQPHLIDSPAEYGFETTGAVTYAEVKLDGVVLGYLWANDEDDACDFEPAASAGIEGQNAAVDWLETLRAYKAREISPSEALADICGNRVTVADSGTVVPESLAEASSLAELRQLAAAA